MHRLQERSGKETAGTERAAARREAVPQFELLETSHHERRRWWASLGASSVIQIVVLIALFWFVSVRFSPEQLETSNKTMTFTLLAPPPENPAPRTRPVRLPQPQPITHAMVAPSTVWKPAVPRETQVTKPKARPQQFLLPRTPALSAPRISAFKPAVPQWKPRTHVGVFGGKRLAATLKMPRWKVQTGGFGDPHGLSGKPKDKTDIPHVGSFDEPQGAGSGNGSGGAHGARGLVASAGFGNAMAGEPGQANAQATRGQTRAAGFGDGMASGTGQSDSPGPGGEPHAAGFGDAAAVPRSAARAATRPTVAAFVPVEIESKPEPVYTAEARRKRIQGTVILRVDFKASGGVEVLGVVHGLGDGLDQAAVRAAEEIQFKPARRDGQAVDTAAVLHILFRLAD